MAAVRFFAAAGLVLASVMLPGRAFTVNTATMKNFGHSIKNGHLIANTEIDLFEHSCKTPPCTITQIHCPTAGPNGWYDAQLKLYIDGDAPITMTLLELAHMGDPTEIGPPPPPPSLPNASEYFLGTMGQSCAAVCANRGLRCSPSINTGWGVDHGKSLQQRLSAFNESILTCKFNQSDDKWFAEDQPGYVCGNDPNSRTGECVGWENVPASVSCNAAYAESCRVCHCVSAQPGSYADSTFSDEPAAPGTGDGGPWGIDLFGHTAKNGGVYSTLRIPFQSKFKATLTSKNSGTFWFIIRGVENYPVVWGDLELPSSAKLKLHRFTNHTTELELVTLLDIPMGTAGAVASVRFDAKSDSGNYGYLEACMRAMIDGGSSPLFLSSGAEDYFLSAYYFNEGEFKTPNSGVTVFDGHGTLSVYKIHDRDPLLFDDGLQLIFRNMEDTTGCGDTLHCPNQFCPGNSSTDSSSGFKAAARRQISRGSTDAQYNTAIWVYEWPRSEVTSNESENLLAYIIELGENELLKPSVEASLLRALARGDANTTALVRAYSKSSNKERAAVMLTKLFS